MIKVNGITPADIIALGGIFKKNLGWRDVRYDFNLVVSGDKFEYFTFADNLKAYFMKNFDFSTIYNYPCMELFNSPEMLLNSITPADLRVRIYGLISEEAYSNKDRVISPTAVNWQVLDFKGSCARAWERFLKQRSIKMYDVKTVGDIPNKSIRDVFEICDIKETGYNAKMSTCTMRNASRFFSVATNQCKVLGIDSHNDDTATLYYDKFFSFKLGQFIVTVKSTESSSGVKGDKANVTLGVYSPELNEYYRKVIS